MRKSSIFGLAKVGSSTTDALARLDTDHLTSPGSTLGTVAYMSPEQVRAKELDARTEVFSFGVVLYEMATGQMPFRGESSGVISKPILDSVPVSPVRLNPDVPVEFINKTLEKDRNLRYQHASELRADLRRVKRDTSTSGTAAFAAASGIADTSTSVRVPAAAEITGVQSGTTTSDTEIAVGLFTRHKKAILSIAAVVVGMLAGLGYGVYRRLSPSSSTIDSIAVLPFANGVRDGNTDYLSDGITESLILNLAHLPQLKMKSRSSVFRYKGKDVDMQKVGKELGVLAVVNGQVLCCVMTQSK
jgi:eukaryotic-like serine/threonine-protein kinase